MRIAAISCALTVSFLSASIGWAAPPNVLGLYPAGVSRGQTAVVTASGTIPDWPVQVKADRPGLTFECDKEKGKIKVTVAADAPLGVYWVRVFNDDGAAMPRPLVVGAVREIEEVEPNDAPDKPQLLDGPATINGRIGKAGDVDLFAIRLTAGQKIVASLQANNLLNSPMDGVIQFAQLEGYVAPSNSAAPAGAAPAGAAAGNAQPNPAAAPVNSGPTAANPLAWRPEAFVLAQKDDETGLDPRLVATAPRDGYYLIRVFAFPSETNANVSFAGGDNYVYRLTITAQPFLDFVLPLAISKTNPSPLHLRGWNLPDALATLPPPTPRDGEQDWAAAERTLFSVARPEAAGGLELPWTDFPTVIADATAAPEKPQVVAWPVSISGVIEEPRDVDAFQVTATKGQKLRLKVDARSLGFPLDPVVQVLDATGKSLVELDDANNQRDVETVFAVPADGDYRVAVRDIHQHGGERYAYRLTVSESKPDFDLSQSPDLVSVTAGKPTEVVVKVDRREGFAEPIQVSVEGLPAGVTATPATSEPKGDSAKTVKLVLNADAAALTQNSSHTLIRIVGTSTAPHAARRVSTFPVPGLPSGQTATWLTVIKPK